MLKYAKCDILILSLQKIKKSVIMLHNKSYIIMAHMFLVGVLVEYMHIFLC